MCFLTLPSLTGMCFLTAHLYRIHHWQVLPDLTLVQDASNKFYIIFEAEDEHFDETVEMLIFSEDDAVGTRIVKAMNKILMDAAARGSLD